MSRGTKTCEMCGAEHDKGTRGYVFILVGMPLLIMAFVIALRADRLIDPWLYWLLLGYCSALAMANAVSDPHI